MCKRVRYDFIIVSCNMALAVISFLNSQVGALPLFVSAAAWVLVLWSMVASRRNYFYLFFSTFLYLGFYLKPCVHLIVGYPFVEPVGGFQYATSEWAHGFYLSGLIAAAILVSRIAHLITYLQKRNPKVALIRAASSTLIVFAGAFIVIMAIANFKLSIYRIGIPAKIALPFGVGAALSWLISFGTGLLAQLAAASLLLKGRVSSAVAVVFFEGAVAAVSTLSRAAMLFHVLPLLAYLFFEKFISGRRLLRYGITFGVLFIGALSIVSLGRIIDYSQADAGAPTLSHDQVVRMAGQVLKLPVDRWIGFEGVLSVEASPRTGYGFAADHVLEPPSNYSIYQQLAGVKRNVNGYDFMALPGVSAMLLYAGSPAILFIGLMLLSLSFQLLERLWWWAFGSQVAAIYCSLYFAQLLSQLNFVILFLDAVFFALLSAFIYRFLRDTRTLNSASNEQPKCHSG